jgi:hypothetical protein
MLLKIKIKFTWQSRAQKTGKYTFKLPFYQLKKWRNSVGRVTIVVMHVVLHTFFLFIQARNARVGSKNDYCHTRALPRKALCMFFLRQENCFHSLVRRRVHLTARSSSLVSIQRRSWRAIFAVPDTARGNNRNNYFHFPWWCGPGRPHQTAHAIIMCK